ncbi:MAG: hypothetical protein HQL42_15565 [Alphaproteobacteria bacterium]|nr:hypothetical protein [Alphaproteobacteria bacterium]
MDSSSIELSRYRQAEQMFGWFLKNVRDQIVAEVETLLAGRNEKSSLKDVASQFQADGDRPRRRHRLAVDLAAAVEVYRVLESHEPPEKDASASIGAMRKHLLAWHGAVDAILNDELSTTARDEFFSVKSLVGLAGLELFLETLIDNVLDHSPLEPGITQEMIRIRMKSVVRDTIADLRMQLLLGKSGDMSAFGTVMKQFHARISGVYADMPDGDPEDGIIRGIDRASELVTAITQSLRLAFQDSKEQRRLADTALILVNQFKAMQEREHGHLRDRVTPDADEALLWCLCLVVDAWRPRSKVRSVEAGVRAYSESAVPVLADNLLTSLGLAGGKGQRKTSTYAGMMRRISKAYSERGQINGVGTALGNRRIFGHESGEFTPDQHDVAVLLPSEAEVIRRHSIEVPDAAVRQRTIQTRFNTPG